MHRDLLQFLLCDFIRVDHLPPLQRGFQKVFDSRNVRLFYGIQSLRVGLTCRADGAPHQSLLDQAVNEPPVSEVFLLFEVTRHFFDFAFAGRTQSETKGLHLRAEHLCQFLFFIILEVEDIAYSGLQSGVR